MGEFPIIAQHAMIEKATLKTGGWGKDERPLYSGNRKLELLMHLIKGCKTVLETGGLRAQRETTCLAYAASLATRCNKAYNLQFPFPKATFGFLE